MTNPILVFGASGRVGSEIIRALPETTPIRAADIFFSNDLPPNVERIHFDFQSPPEDLSPLFNNVTSMFLIWPPGVSAQRAVPPVILAAAENGVQKVVFLSILGAEQLRVVPHRSLELKLIESGMDLVFLRSAYFMQNLIGIHAPEIQNSNEIFIPAGSGKLGLIDVRDVAAVGALALKNDLKNTAYNLTGPESLSFHHAAKIFSEVLGRKITYSNPSIINFFRKMKKRGISTGLIVFMIIEYTAAKLGNPGRVTDEVQSILGRKAISLAQFVNDFQEAWD